MARIGRSRPVSNYRPIYSNLGSGMGTLTVTLQGVTVAFDGAHEASGSSAITLSQVTESFDGVVNPIGSIGISLSSVVINLGSETTPFGAHVIHVEPEKRGFQVIDDDPGLIPIYLNQVNIPPLPDGGFDLTLPRVLVEIEAREPQGSFGLSLPSVQADITAKKVNIVYATNIGNGASTSFTVTHNLGSRDVLTCVYEAASPYEEVLPTSIEHTTTNTITVTFPAAPTTNQYRVVVVYG